MGLSEVIVGEDRGDAYDDANGLILWKGRLSDTICPKK
jgi:hypothetical protein